MPPRLYSVGAGLEGLKQKFDFVRLSIAKFEVFDGPVRNQLHLDFVALAGENHVDCLLHIVIDQCSVEIDNQNESLHTSGIWVPVILEDYKCQALVDTGSTKSFISPTVTTKLNKEIVPASGSQGRHKRCQVGWIAAPQ